MKQNSKKRNRINRSSSESPPESRNFFRQCFKNSPKWSNPSKSPPSPSFRRGEKGINKSQPPSPLSLEKNKLPTLSLLDVKKIPDSLRSSRQFSPPSLRMSHPSPPPSLRMSHPSPPPSLLMSPQLRKPKPSHYTLNMAAQVESNQPNSMNGLAGLFEKKKLGGSVKIRKQKINKNIKKVINKNKTKKRNLRKYRL